LLELTISIYTKKQHLEQHNQKFGAVDKRLMKQAEELLFGELATALNISKDAVQNYIASRVVSGEVSE
jgi:CarD family transcriptional regulator